MAMESSVVTMVVQAVFGMMMRASFSVAPGNYPDLASSTLGLLNGESRVFIFCDDLLDYFNHEIT